MYLKSIILNAFIFAIIVAVVWIAYLVDGMFGWQSFASLPMRILGVALLLIGFFFRFWASGLFHKQGIAVLRPNAQHFLVVTGPYRWSRNPLYVGIVSLTLGCALWLGSYGGLVVAVLTFLMWDSWARFHEEKNLEATFGDEYRQYKQQVRRWI